MKKYFILLMAFSLFAGCGSKSPDKEKATEVAKDAKIMNKPESPPASTQDSSCDAVLDAIRKKKYDKVKELVDKGSDVNCADSVGNTLLIIAASFENIDLTKWLINKGAKVSLTNRYKGDALTEAVRRGNVELIKYLIDSGADANIMLGEKNDWSLEMWGASLGHLDAVKYLIERKGNDIASKTGYEALVYASILGDTAKAKKLIDEGVSPNDKTIEGFKPLNLSILFGNVDIARLLIDNGADIDWYDSIDINPMILAAKAGYLDIVKLLLKKGALIRMDYNFPLVKAAQNGHLEIVKIFVEEKSADVNFVDFEKTPLIMYAAYGGNPKLIKYLVDAGADVNSYSMKKDIEGMTALMVAAENGYVKIAEELIKSGANVNAQDSRGGTALAWASINGKTKVMDILKKAGAKE